MLPLQVLPTKCFAPFALLSSSPPPISTLSHNHRHSQCQLPTATSSTYYHQVLCFIICFHVLLLLCNPHILVRSLLCLFLSLSLSFSPLTFLLPLLPALFLLYSCASYSSHTFICSAHIQPTHTTHTLTLSVTQFATGVFGNTLRGSTHTVRKRPGH